MAFNIADAFADLSPKGPIRTMITEIELHLIDKNPANFYSMDGIDELADNIRMFGLMEPLIVKKTESGRYMLISGHRRRAALKKLAEEGYFPEGMHHKVDCILHEGPVNLPGIEGLERMEAAVRIYEQLKVLYANADTRELTSADKAMQVRQIRELLTQLKNLGYKLPGRMRDLIADAAKVSASRVARLEVIEKNLTDPRLRAAWKAGDLNETNAYEVARYTPEVQKHMTDMQVQHVCRSTSDQVKAFMPSVEADYEVARRLPPEDGEDAAETQKKLSTVDTSAVEFDGKGHIVWDADSYMKQRREEDAVYAGMLQSEAVALLRKIRKINDRQDGIEQLKTAHGKGHSGWTTKDGYVNASPKGLELRTRDGKHIMRTWTEVYDVLCAYVMNRAPEIIGKKKLSTPDNISATSRKWSTGTPTAIGSYVIVAGYPPKETQNATLRTIKKWNGTDWVDEKTNVRVDMTVYRWVQLPADN